MKIIRKSVKKARIEIIPMIDVIFFLLVFFMISSLAHEKFNSISVNLPKTSSQASAVKQKITLSIEKTGKFYLNQTEVTLPSLPGILSKIMKEMPDETIVINADQNSNYGIVMSAIDAAKTIGVRKFALLSKHEELHP